MVPSDGYHISDLSSSQYSGSSENPTPPYSVPTTTPPPTPGNAIHYQTPQQMQFGYDYASHHYGYDQIYQQSNPYNQWPFDYQQQQWNSPSNPHHKYPFHQQQQASQELTSSRSENQKKAPRKPRGSYTHAQVVLLEEQFIKSKFIGGSDREKLSKATGLSEQQVKIWFQNKRARIRKLEELQQKNSPICVPSTNNVFLFAYSNDLDASTVAAVRDGVVYDWAWQHDPIVGNIRSDVRHEEEIQFHRDVVSFNSSVSSSLPNPSLGYGDNTTDSDVFNVIQKFLNNTEAPICDAVLYIIVKRYPGTDQINHLISQLQKNHIYVYYHVHSNPSGGQYRHVMFDMSALTNGFCIFADDNGKTKEFTLSARNGVGLINRPYQYISKRYVVQPGFGRIELPTFQSPNPNASKEQVLAVTTVEETPLDGSYLSLNYTVKSVDGTVLTAFPGGYWTRLGSGIINYFDMNGKVNYTWTIDYHYSAGRQQVIEHRVYGFYYHDFLPFAKIVP